MGGPRAFMATDEQIEAALRAAGGYQLGALALLEYSTWGTSGTISNRIKRSPRLQAVMTELLGPPGSYERKKFQRERSRGAAYRPWKNKTPLPADAKPAKLAEGTIRTHNVPMYRDLDCRSCDRCLDHACVLNWGSFHCQECPRFEDESEITA